MNISLLNSVCYTIGWFWCVLLGIQGQSLLAAIGATLLIFLQLYFTKIKELFLYVQDLLLVFFAPALGFLMEMFFIWTGIIHYSHSNNIVPPAWILFLYPLFSLLLNHSLSFSKKNYLLAFSLGFFCAPISYFAGNSLGGLTFHYSALPTWIAIGTCWGLFLSLLVKLAHTIENAAAQTFSERDSNGMLRFLFDGDCPICQREICLLKKRDSRSKVHFINIASKDFSPAENRNIDFNQAMSQIHAIEDNGQILVGIPAFANVYARCNLLVLSTLFRLPFIKPIITFLYSLFAKYRLSITGRVIQNKNKRS